MALKSGKMNVITKILSARQEKKPFLAVLVDPDKEDVYPSLFPYLTDVDMVLVGGSTGKGVEQCISLLRQHTLAPIILFPGNTSQFSPNADALLFLTLMNSRRPEILIEPHIQSALDVKQSHIEVISMGYILVDGERRSAVEIVTNCQPLSRSDVHDVVRHAVASELLGKQLVYLEAGSGANTPISSELIAAVRQNLDVPLVVGGGIVSPNMMRQSFQAGADVVVVGNHFEHHPEELPIFIRAKQNFIDEYTAY